MTVTRFLFPSSPLPLCSAIPCHLFQCLIFDHAACTSNEGLVSDV